MHHIKTDAQKLNTLRMMWSAFIVSHLLFAGLVLSGLVISDPQPLTAEEPETLPLILSAFSVLDLFMAHVMRYLIYFRAKAQLPLAQRLIRYQTATLVAFALAESATLFGFLIAILTRVPASVIPFTALGLLCHLTLFPQHSHIDD